MRRRRSVTALLAAACLGLPACTGADAELGEASSEAAEVVPIEGTGLSRITLSSEAYERLGVKTEGVRQEPASSRRASKLTVVPVAAVLYDPQGQTWTYTSPQRLTFVRQPVIIDHVDGDLAHLRDGPAPGTPVVTVGASELLGAEYGVGEE